jgi:hypothetical protein
MTTMRIDVDDAQALRNLRFISQEQWPFALTLALTRTAQLAQGAVRAATRANFKLHGEFIPRGIRVKPAKKGDVKMGSGTAEVFTAPGISGWMPLHETGGEKVPGSHSGGVDRGKYLALPGEDLRKKSHKTGTGRTRKKWTPATLLKDYSKRTSGGDVVRVGRGGRKGKPFIISGQFSGVPMIVRRASKGRYPLELLYIFSKRATIKPVWDFEDTINKMVRMEFTNQLRKAVQQAITTRR